MSRFGVILLCFAFIVMGTAVISIAAFYTAAAAARDEALETLASTRMELAVRRTAEELSRQVLHTREQEEAEASRALAEAKNSFLQREAEETLMLVNPWNPLPEDYEPRLVDIGDGMQIDERVAGALQKMLEACRASGVVPVPISGYRTQEYQQGLFDDKLKRVYALGYAGDAAVAKAAEEVAFPGTSEHQLGLCVDILDVDNPELDITQEWTDTQRWLMAHCAEYGFILRYPNGTSELTGIIYEPWHYRYVGKTTAKEITDAGITLEEYLQQQS